MIETFQPLSEKTLSGRPPLSGGYREMLREAFVDGIRKNPAISLRSFSQQIGISHTTLVQVLSKQKRLSVRRGDEVATRLGLEGIQHELFCLFVQIENTSDPKVLMRLGQRLAELNPNAGESALQKQMISVEQFELISGWYHFPILQMLKHFTPQPDARQLSKKLGIYIFQAKDSLALLEKLGLIQAKETNGYQVLKDSTLVSSPQERNRALGEFHRTMLKKAEESLVTYLPNERWIGTETIAFNAESLPRVADEIERCFENILKISDSIPKKNQVFHLITSFFPLTNTSPTKDQSI
jgi:uncharacterized protein (TIGR02147 family)